MFSQVKLLPRTYLGATTGAAVSSSSEDTHASEMGNSNETDWRPAWTWAPMNIKEIQDADAACAVVANISGNEETSDRNQSGGLGDAPVSTDDADCNEDTLSSVGQGGESDTGEKEEVYWEGEEGDGGGAGGRARQRMRAGGKRLQAGHGREADVSVRYLISKVKATPNIVKDTNWCEEGEVW